MPQMMRKLCVAARAKAIIAAVVEAVDKVMRVVLEVVGRVKQMNPNLKSLPPTIAQLKRITMEENDIVTIVVVIVPLPTKKIRDLTAILLHEEAMKRNVAANVKQRACDLLQSTNSSQEEEKVMLVVEEILRVSKESTADMNIAEGTDAIAVSVERSQGQVAVP